MKQIRLHKKSPWCFRFSDCTNLFLQTLGMIFIYNSQYYFQRQAIREVLSRFARVLGQMWSSNRARIYYVSLLLMLRRFCSSGKRKL